MGSLASSAVAAIISQQLRALFPLGLALYTSPLSPSHLIDPIFHGIGSIIVPFYRREN